MTKIYLLALLAMSPILIWGIWIISEESFDELNSNLRSTHRDSTRNKSIISSLDSKLISKKAELQQPRTFRNKFLPLYFVLMLISLFGFLAILFQDALPGTQLLIFAIGLTGFVLHLRKSNNKVMAQLNKELEDEIGTQIQLLTILISSGMSPAKSISVLSKSNHSVSSQALARVVEDVESGFSLVEALDRLKSAYPSTSLRRFVTTLILGIERGSALTPILTAQVRDSRTAHKNEVMRRAGKAEIGLMIPVVFLILPISILFALWPSYQQLGSFV